MGLLDRFRRRPDESSGHHDEDAVDAATLEAAVADLWQPCVLLRPTGEPPSRASGSHVGGHPWMPTGSSWPTDPAGRPLVFVGQFDLGDLPPHPDFPDTGLLQWFVRADDTHGLTFDDQAGRVGFAIRWFPDTSGDSSSAPSDPVPDRTDPDAGWDLFPLEVGADGPIALAGVAARCLPRFAAVPDDRHPLVRRYATQLGEDPDDLAFVWEEYVAGPSSPLDVGRGSMLGGTAAFTQFDPRGTAGYPATDDPAGRQLVQLDADEFGGWGDLGIAHLFGDPAALAHGDTSSITYHWDCS